MAIQLIDKIKQKNDGNFFLVDAADVEYNGESLEKALENQTGVVAATDEEVAEMLDELFGTAETE